MLVVMKPHASEGEIAAVVERIRSLGLTPHPIPGAQRVAIGITGNKGGLEPELFETLPGVQDALRVSQPFKLVSREVKEEDTVIDVGGVPLGGNALAIEPGDGVGLERLEVRGERGQRSGVERRQVRADRVGAQVLHQEPERAQEGEDVAPSRAGARRRHVPGEEHDARQVEG